MTMKKIKLFEQFCENILNENLKKEVSKIEKKIDSGEIKVSGDWIEVLDGPDPFGKNEINHWYWDGEYVAVETGKTTKDWDEKITDVKDFITLMLKGSLSFGSWMSY